MIFAHIPYFHNSSPHGNYKLGLYVLLTYRANSPIVTLGGDIMPDYKKMYFELFNAVTIAINHLQNSQSNGENAYIQNGDTPLKVLPNLSVNEQKILDKHDGFK